MAPQDLLLLVMIVAVFWFVAVRPQQQRAKQQKAMLGALAPGDDVVTVGGIYGTVVEVGERIRLRVLDGSELEIAPQAIARVIPPASSDSTDESAEGDSAEPSAGDAEAAGATTDEAEAAESDDGR